MKQNLLTIITSIKPGHKEALEALLRKYNPSLSDDETHAVFPSTDLDLATLPNLHLASFLILDPEIKGASDETGCYSLVFEATFDGSAQSFINDFFELCCMGVGNIYSHCIGFPDADAGSPQVVHQYLLDHHVPANTAYAGSPGKTVAQVVGESKLRNRISQFLLEYRQTPGSVPPLYEQIRTHITRKIIRGETPRKATRTPGGRPKAQWKTAHGEFRWAEEQPHKSALVTNGPQRLKLLAFAVLTVITFILGLILHWSGKLEFHTTVNGVEHWPEKIDQFVSPIKLYFDPLYKYLVSSTTPLMVFFGIWFGSLLLLWAHRTTQPVQETFSTEETLNKTGIRLEFLNYSAFTVFIAVLTLTWGAHQNSPGLNTIYMIAAIWIVLRTIEFALHLFWPDPRDAEFLGRTFEIIIKFGRALSYRVLTALTLFLVIAVLAAPDTTKPNPFGIKQLGEWNLGLYRDLFNTVGLPGLSPTPNPGNGQLVVAGLCALLFALVMLVILRSMRTRLQIQNELRHLTKVEKALRWFKLDIVKGSIFALYWFLVAYVIHGILSQAPSFLSELVRDALVFVQHIALYVLVFAVYAGFVFCILLLIYVIVMLCVRLVEVLDQAKYKPASDLTKRPKDNVQAYSREEHGINKYQNHLASLTHVKGGLVRLAFLRIILWGANIRARYIFTKGDLAGIPTIIYARWVLINRGRRLLFMTNYGGAWESYLNEFIDMKAVKGLNAIWTNTHLPGATREEQVNFPPTKGLFWQGAQFERPFKAYVRKSQVETLLWYSAYPNLSIRNIVDNGKLRDGLVHGSLPSEQMDELAKRL